MLPKLQSDFTTIGNFYTAEQNFNQEGFMLQSNTRQNGGKKLSLSLVLQIRKKYQAGTMSMCPSTINLRIHPIAHTTT